VAVAAETGQITAKVFLQLDEQNLKTAAHWLAERDEALALVLERYGYPPLWARKPDFSTLVHIILEQQVSLASANACFEKLKACLEGRITPERFISLDDETLRAAGFSRQKTLYTRFLATELLENRLHLDSFKSLSDEAVRARLIQLKGIGLWTADIYLSECLLRPDILPKGDIALLEAFKVLKGLDKRPEHPEFEQATGHWRPWRSVGIRMLWHFYLSERRKFDV
jgi:DNA-3-methyladenine glycosylase II